MRPAVVGLCLALFVGGALVGGAFAMREATAQAPGAEMQCGSTSAPRVRTTLYFGLARPKGSISELEWQVFLRDEVTPRFPEGLTVWEADGQWRRGDGVVDHERTKVLLLVHPDTGAALTGVQDVIAQYRQKFDQESVLWETARVCVG
jgi:hypothetical protein